MQGKILLASRLLIAACIAAVLAGCHSAQPDPNQDAYGSPLSSKSAFHGQGHLAGGIVNK